MLATIVRISPVGLASSRCSGVGRRQRFVGIFVPIHEGVEPSR